MDPGVAVRLSENPDVKVGVIEAGANRMDGEFTFYRCYDQTLSNVAKTLRSIRRLCIRP